ncbi:pyrroline-5-carboxylate reductase [Psychrobacter pygoscelis]|uniref:pyrroline-5-carboxylate reductase n=1 Tax=Psychrobacter pygoscelis TaxID=2488563 RepID=UPI00103AC0E0|nr:pyrroline-5-carboxylate reductase [Psychrobacter pygoscelis]
MSLLDNKKIIFIGGGNMAQALISGLLGRSVEAGNITVSDPSAEIRAQLAKKDITSIDPTQDMAAAKQAVQSADVVMLAVKPQVMSKVIPDFAEVLEQQLVMSVAAGLSTDSLSQMLQGYRTIVRAMPNTPAMIQMGATGLFASEAITEEQRQLAYEVMAASGLVMWVEEEAQLHAVTAVSGSAPAYFFYFIESIIDGGVALGLERKQAAALAMQTALGAAQMSIASDEPPAELRRKVTSPNGTTQAAIESMQSSEIGEHIKQAMQACYERSQAISSEMNQ